MTFELGATIVTITSIVLAILTNKIRSLIVRLSLIAAFTYGLSYSLYWYPVWLGATGDQYSSWAPIFINICFVYGLLGALATIGLLGWLKKRNEKSKSS